MFMEESTVILQSPRTLSYFYVSINEEKFSFTVYSSKNFCYDLETPKKLCIFTEV